MTLLPNGKILIAGGYDGQNDSGLGCVPLRVERDLSSNSRMIFGRGNRIAQLGTFGRSGPFDRLNQHHPELFLPMRAGEARQHEAGGAREYRRHLRVRHERLELDQRSDAELARVRLQASLLGPGPDDQRSRRAETPAGDHPAIDCRQRAQ